MEQELRKKYLRLIAPMNQKSEQSDGVSDVTGEDDGWILRKFCLTMAFPLDILT